MSIDQALRGALTTEQYDAVVDPTAGFVCLACAASGKSRSLANRISRLLAEGEPADGIVAFTFTEKAAESIKRPESQALQAASLDPTSIGAMCIGTIHRYFQRVLGDIDSTYRQYDVLDENRLKVHLILRYYDMRLHDFHSHPRGNSYIETIKQTSDAWKTVNDELLALVAVSVENQAPEDLLQRIRPGLRDDQFMDFSLRSDFPTRPHPEKCGKCDFRPICLLAPQSFNGSSGVRPEFHLPDGKEMARAFSFYKDP